jgi:DtxR family Mn-dependent transcriptional regulator
VMRKHRLAERLLSDVIGLEWEFVHDEACRWEHVMSEQVERKILEILGHPTESPYGNPIPGLDELGDSPAVAFMAGVTNLLDVVAASAQPVSAVIRRMGEPVQFDPELLAQLKQSGVMPGNTGVFSAVGSYVLVRVEGFGDGLELPNEVAGHIFVTTPPAGV